MHSDHGPCHPRRPETRWFYNHNNKQCEQFSYGGCDGNKNNYKTKDDCEKGCGGLFGKTLCFKMASLPKLKPYFRHRACDHVLLTYQDFFCFS